MQNVADGVVKTNVSAKLVALLEVAQVALRSASPFVPEKILSMQNLTAIGGRRTNLWRLSCMVRFINVAFSLLF